MGVYKIAGEIQFINALQPGGSTSKIAVQLHLFDLMPRYEVHFKPQFNFSSLMDLNWNSNRTSIAFI